MAPQQCTYSLLREPSPSNNPAGRVVSSLPPRLLGLETQETKENGSVGFAKPLMSSHTLEYRGTYWKMSFCLIRASSLFIGINKTTTHLLSYSINVKRKVEHLFQDDTLYFVFALQCKYFVDIASFVKYYQMPFKIEMTPNPYKPSLKTRQGRSAPGRLYCLNTFRPSFVGGVSCS